MNQQLHTTKSGFLGALFAGAMLFGANTASAIPFLDINDYGTGVRLSASGNSTKTDQFNILDHGFDPVTMDVTAAAIGFYLVDDSWMDGDEEVKITLDSGNLVNGYEVGFGTIVGGLYFSGTVLTQLQDGVLSYTVRALEGDFYLKKAALLADATYVKPGGNTPPPAVSVPDGGMTVFLLGLGFLGVAALHRKLAPAR